MLTTKCSVKGRRRHESPVLSKVGMGCAMQTRTHKTSQGDKDQSALPVPQSCCDCEGSGRLLVMLAPLREG